MQVLWPLIGVILWMWSFIMMGISLGRFNYFPWKRRYSAAFVLITLVPFMLMPMKVLKAEILRLHAEQKAIVDACEGLWAKVPGGQFKCYLKEDL